MTNYTREGIPILDLSEEDLDYVQGKHEAAMEAWQDQSDDLEDDHLYVGEKIAIHNKSPINAPEQEDVTWVTIGACTLDEALKSAIGAFDQGHVTGGDHINTPDWVASTDEDLARLLGAHYGAAVLDISEVR